jgi:hypothetical protein
LWAAPAGNLESAKLGGSPGAAKPDNLLGFGWSEYSFTTALLTDAQPIDDPMVALGMASLQIFQQAPSLAYHDQQSTSRTMVLAMDAKMLIEVVDPLTQDGNLYLG